MLAFLARVILIVIAITVVRSVFGYVARLFAGGVKPPPQQRPAAPAPPSATSLEQDPVCGTYVSVDSSLKRMVKGKVYHFCSEECKARFTV